MNEQIIITRDDIRQMVRNRLVEAGVRKSEAAKVAETIKDGARVTARAV